MPSDTAFAADDEPDPLLRPAWEDTPDETDERGRAPAGRAAQSRPDPWRSSDHLHALLRPLCAATDALARLDARAAAAHDAIRTGLIARMAFAEAAGWLAHTHAWIHPLDLALREAGLSASTALSALGAGHHARPQAFAGEADHRDWADPRLDAMADGNRAVAEALALARVLRRLPGKTGTNPFADATKAAETLHALGAGVLDPNRLADWWQARPPWPPVRRHRLGGRDGEGGDPPLPALLDVARAAQSWMETGLADHPAPAHALLAAAGLFARDGVVKAVALPIWAAYPAAGFGDRAALPSLRSDAADRLVGRGRTVSWPLAFLHLVTESARAALRELTRLEAAAETGRGLAAAIDKRSRLPDAVDALLRVPVLTPKALAARLRIAPQTATALLRVLQAEGLAREVTGRASFRAFAV
jgi:hypothetical protein